MILASAAVGSARANTANKTTRLIINAPPIFPLYNSGGSFLPQCGDLHSPALGQSPTVDSSQNTTSTLHMGYQSMLPILLLKTNDLRKQFLLTACVAMQRAAHSL